MNRTNQDIKNQYWLPMLTTTLIGAIVLCVVAFSNQEGNPREVTLWFGGFAALVFIGLLRESLLLPDLGNPLTNLLAAFVPFFLSSLCLCFGTSRLVGHHEREPFAGRDRQDLTAT